jgi:RNA ligase
LGSFARDGKKEDNVEFKEFEKIARLNREVVVTEKIDGTNGLVWVSDDSTIVRAGSRSRWITPEEDNFGFARWVAENVEELRKLGPGYHYGEWWGAGIQRRYGLTTKRWSLFNVALWTDDAVRPKCCHVVPTLGAGIGLANTEGSVVGDALRMLKVCGSQAAPGFMRPEGVVIYHTAARSLFKVTLEKDEAPKGNVSA